MEEGENMRRKPKLYFLSFLSVALLLIIGGCGPLGNFSQNSQPTTPTNLPVQQTEKKLTVAAAADLSLAFKEIGHNFEQSSGSKVVFIFGSTGQLAQQIENGAPFDILAAANVSFVDDLKKKGKVIAYTEQLYAQGKIGLAASVKNSLQVNDLKDLLKPEIKKIAIANPDHAPYGMAAKQALQKAGIWDQVKDKLVYGKNISDTVSYITTGNAEAGIIAQSLAKPNETRFVLIDTSLYEPLNQAIAVIHGTNQEKLARQFIQYLNSPEGRQILQKYGYAAPAEAKK